MKNDSYHTYTDRHLLDLLHQSDDAAFTAIYNRYWEKLLFIGAVKLRDRLVAEELVQEIFLDLWNRRQVLNITGHLEAYLAVSMKYRVINAQVRRKREKEYREHIINHFNDLDDSTQQSLEFEQLKDRLAELVTALPEKCRITYHLSREEGLSHKEIAAKMSITQKSVESNLSRALKALQNMLTRCFYFFL